MKRLLIALSACLPAAVHADVITDGTVGSAVELSGPNFQIETTLGTQQGENLFHSFQAFNLTSAETAEFLANNTIRNIIARVTGGASTIDGTLRSPVNLYFFNPSGIVIGAGARLDVQGALHLGTANALEFADGAEFSAIAPEASTLSIAEPSAFGFSEMPARLDIAGQLQVASGASLNIGGGEIRIQDGTLYAPGGQIDIDANILDISQTSIVNNLPIGIHNNPLANIDVSGDTAGSINIQVNQLRMNNALIFADSYVGGDAKGININAAQSVELLNGARITADNLGAGQGGNILVQTPLLHFSGFSPDFSDGLIALSRISTNNLGDGTGGEVRLQVSSLEMEPGLIQAAADLRFGNGNAGSVYISADKAQLTDSTIFTLGKINAGGDITFEIRDYMVIRRSEISSDAADGGGAINFLTASPLIAEQSTISARAFFGPGGDIIFETNPLADSTTTIITSPGGEIIIKSPEGEIDINQLLTPGHFIAAQFTDQRCARGPVSRLFNASLPGLPQTPTSLILHVPKFADIADNVSSIQPLAMNNIFSRQSCSL